MKEFEKRNIEKISHKTFETRNYPWSLFSVMSFDSARERDAFEQSINEDVGVFVESPEMNEDINYKNNENDNEESPREEPHIDVVDEADQVCF